MKKSKILLITSRVISLAIFGILSIFMIPHSYEALVHGQTNTANNASAEGAIMGLMYVLLLLGVIAMWKSQKLGGILMLASGIIVILGLIIISSNFGGILFGVPIIIAGVLAILSVDGKSISSPSVST